MIPPEFPNKPSFWSVQLASVYLLIQADRKVPLLEWEARLPLQPGPDWEVLGAANQLLQAFLLGPMDPGLGQQLPQRRLTGTGHPPLDPGDTGTAKRHCEGLRRP